MRSLVLITIMITLSQLTKSQTWAPIGAKWYYSASAGGAAPTGSEYYLYESQKDTVVAGQSCKKITVTYFMYLNGDTSFLPPVFSYQSTDTVFYFNTTYSKFFPLYIFNVSEGDTLFYHNPEIQDDPADTLFRVVVDSTSIFTVDGIPLQQVFTTPLDNYSLGFRYIERIGGTWLMLHQPSAVFPEWDGPLRCYSDSNISHNFFSLPCDFHLTSGIEETENAFGILLFPNPASNLIYLKTTYPGRINFKISNAFGQVLKAGGFQREIAIPNDEYASGIYTIELSADNKSERKIFIIN